MTQPATDVWRVDDPLMRQLVCPDCTWHTPAHRCTHTAQQATRNPMLRGWICPVCGAGVAPWKTEHCTKEISTNG